MAGKLSQPLPSRASMFQTANKTEVRLSQPPVTTSTPRPRQDRSLLLKNFYDVSPILPGPNLIRKAKSSGMNKTKENSPEVVKKPRSLIPIYKGSTNCSELAASSKVTTTQNKKPVPVNNSKGGTPLPGTSSSQHESGKAGGRKSKEAIDVSEIFREARTFMKELKKQSISPDSQGKPQNLYRTVQQPSVDVIPEVAEGNKNQSPIKKSTHENTFRSPEEIAKLPVWPNSPLPKKNRISLKRKSSVSKIATKKPKTMKAIDEENSESIFGSPKVPNLVELSSLADKRKTFVMKQKSSLSLERKIKGKEHRESVFPGITPLEAMTNTMSENEIVNRTENKKLDNKVNQIEPDNYPVGSKKRAGKMKSSKEPRKRSKRIINNENETPLDKYRSVRVVENEICNNEEAYRKEDKKIEKNDYNEVMNSKEPQEKNIEIQAGHAIELHPNVEIYKTSENETGRKSKRCRKPLATIKSQGDLKHSSEVPKEGKVKKSLKQNEKEKSSKDKLEHTITESLETKQKRGRKHIISENENNNLADENITDKVENNRSPLIKVDMIPKHGDEAKREENEFNFAKDVKKPRRQKKSKCVTGHLVNSKETELKLQEHEIIDPSGSENTKIVHGQVKEKPSDEIPEKNDVSDYVCLTQNKRSENFEHQENNRIITHNKKSARKRNDLRNEEKLEKSDSNKSVTGSNPLSQPSDNKSKTKRNPASKKVTVKNKPSKPLESNNSVSQMNATNEAEEIIAEPVVKKGTSRKVSKYRVNKTKTVSTQSTKTKLENKSATITEQLENNIGEQELRSKINCCEREDQLNNIAEASQTVSCRKKRTPIAYWSNKKTSIYEPKDDFNDSREEQQLRSASKCQLEGSDKDKFGTQELFGLKRVKIQQLRPGVEASIYLHIDDYVMSGWVQVEPGASITKISTNTIFLVEEGAATVRIGSHTRNFGCYTERRSFFIPRMIDASITNEGHGTLRMAFTKFRGSRAN